MESPFYILITKLENNVQSKTLHLNSTAYIIWTRLKVLSLTYWRNLDIKLELLILNIKLKRSQQEYEDENFW